MYNECSDDLLVFNSKKGTIAVVWSTNHAAVLLVGVPRRVNLCGVDYLEWQKSSKS